MLTSCAYWLFREYKCLTRIWHSCNVGVRGRWGGKWTSSGSTVALNGKPVDEIRGFPSSVGCVFTQSWLIDIDLLKILQSIKVLSCSHVLLLWTSTLQRSRSVALRNQEYYSRNYKQEAQQWHTLGMLRGNFQDRIIKWRHLATSDQCRLGQTVMWARPTFQDQDQGF